MYLRNSLHGAGTWIFAGEFLKPHACARASSALIWKKCGAQPTLASGRDAWAMSNGSRLKPGLCAFLRTGRLVKRCERGSDVHRPVKMWGSAVRLTYVLGIRAVRLRRNWPRASLQIARCIPRDRYEDLHNSLAVHPAGTAGLFSPTVSPIVETPWPFVLENAAKKRWMFRKYVRVTCLINL